MIIALASGLDIHVNSSLDVIARESGRSSIPEAAVVTSDVSGILDAPLSRSMTAEGASRSIPAARADATVGELVSALADVLGRYRPGS